MNMPPMEFEELTLSELFRSSLANQTAKLMLDAASCGLPLVIKMQDGSELTSSGLLPTLRLIRERFGWSPPDC